MTSPDLPDLTVIIWPWSWLCLYVCCVDSFASCILFCFLVLFLCNKSCCWIIVFFLKFKRGGGAYYSLWFLCHIYHPLTGVYSFHLVSFIYPSVHLANHSYITYIYTQTIFSSFLFLFLSFSPSKHNTNQNKSSHTTSTNHSKPHMMLHPITSKDPQTLANLIQSDPVTKMLSEPIRGERIMSDKHSTHESNNEMLCNTLPPPPPPPPHRKTTRKSP